MRDNPLVSIVMPVHNAGRFLRLAINDMRAQTYNNWELICVDDGSTDQSLLVLEFFAAIDSRIRIIAQENKGAGAARNIGIDTASGEYLLFLDADDRFESDLLESTVENAKQTKAQIVVFNGEIFDANTLVVMDYALPMREKDEVFLQGEYDPFFIINNGGVVWNKLFDREFVVRSNIRFQQTLYQNDCFFSVLLLALADRISWLNRTEISYRKNHEGTLSANSKKKDKPQLMFDILYSIKEKLTEVNKYETLWKSFANLAVMEICVMYQAVNVHNIELFKNRINKQFLMDMRINELQESDFAYDEMYKEMMDIWQYEFDGFMCSAIRYNEVTAKSYASQGLDRRKINNDTLRLVSGNRIVLYGAGQRGRWLYMYASETNEYEVVAWCDRRYSELHEVLGVEIISPDSIGKYDFDYVVISVDDARVVGEIGDMLVNLKIDRNKIVWY